LISGGSLNNHLNRINLYFIVLFYLLDSLLFEEPRLFSFELELDLFAELLLLLLLEEVDLED